MQIPGTTVLPSRSRASITPSFSVPGWCQKVSNTFFLRLLGGDYGLPPPF